jgi:hypothetical protein
MEFKRKQKEEQQKLKELQAKAAQKGPLGMDNDSSSTLLSIISSI